jgi:hypothetical protein
MIIAVAILLAAAAPGQFDINAFFQGRTHADNELSVVFHGTKKLIVDSIGHREGNEFVLVDTVREEGKPVRTRKWVMHEVAPGRFTGTLSDATGPVDIAINGDTATIRYTMKDGNLTIVQQMKMQPGGRTLSNHVDARKFGMKFGTVQGIIRKLD